MTHQFTKQNTIIFLNNKPYGRIDDDKQQWIMLTGDVVVFKPVN